MKYERWEGLGEMIELGRLNGRMPAHKRKVDRAVTECAKAMMEHEGAIMASVSGGKDSVAMLPIIEQAAQISHRDYSIWGHVSTASFPETRETIREAGRRMGRQVILDECPFDAFEVVGKGSAQKYGKKGYFADSIARVYREMGVGIGFVGVRAGESKRRSKAIARLGYGFDSRTYGKQVHIVYPLAYMSVTDVFSLLVVNDLPIHPIYGKFAVGDLPIRLGYVTAVDQMDGDAALFLHVNYPDLYNRLAAVYPDVRLFG